MDELHVLVLSGPQDFCDVKRGSIWIFSEQLCPDLWIPKIREKEYCSILIHGMLWCSTVIPLPSTFQNQSVHPSGCWDHWRLYHGVASSGDRSLISWLKMISLFLWSSASCYRMLWSVEIQLPGCNQGQFYKPS